MSPPRPDTKPLDLGESPWQAALKRVRRDRVAMFFALVFASYAAVALLAQIVELAQGPPFTYELTLSELGYELPETAVGPNTATPLAWWGTTSAGKSVILRVFHGTKVAFVVGICGAALSAVIGTCLGLVAGWFGRAVDELVVYLYSTVASIPWLLLMLALAFVVRQGPIAVWYRDQVFSDYLSLGLFNIVLVVGLTSWVTLCRLVRAEVKKIRELEYVQAARALGMSDMRILRVHVLPNVMHLVIINFSLTFVTAIKSEVILTFLGVGVDREPSWGQMISDARNELMQGTWWPLMASGLALFVLTLAVNYVGDALRDALDPRLRGTR